VVGGTNTENMLHRGLWRWRGGEGTFRSSVPFTGGGTCCPEEKWVEGSGSFRGGGRSVKRAAFSHGEARFAERWRKNVCFVVTGLGGKRGGRTRG